MTQRLNVWTRLGIVVTVLWLIGGTFGIYMYGLDQRYAYAETYYKDCEAGLAATPKQFDFLVTEADHKACKDNQINWLHAQPPRLEVFAYSLMDAVGFAVLGWLLALIGIATTRWVLRGRASTL